MSIFSKAMDKSGAASTVKLVSDASPKEDGELSKSINQEKNSFKSNRKEKDQFPAYNVSNTKDIHPIADHVKSMGMLASGEAVRELADAYRRIKRPLLMNAFGKGAIEGESSNLILVTSSVMGEGKTYTALNLALSIALEKDNTVLLVDTDAVRQDLTNRLNLTGRNGLTDVLDKDDLDLCDVLLRTDIPNLVILPAGKRHEYVTELLSSKKMKSLVNDIANRYPDRVIIFDSPPLMAAPQTHVLAYLVGQIVFVIESGKTPRSVVEEALESIGDSKALGVVLNKNWRSSKRYTRYSYQ